MNFGLASLALLLCCVLLMSVPNNAAELTPNSSGLQRPNSNPTMEQFELQRKQMVKYQLHDRGIQDERVLTAMSKVPRHQFVDLSLRDLAKARSRLSYRLSTDHLSTLYRGLHD
ncbi:MAG: hypothetical protein QNJ72_17850 [Pleurocapsa sp. MO_226.B13]|nr:hypothetical protein [Pleurocapsa sp. MO_226.B13]